MNENKDTTRKFVSTDKVLLKRKFIAVNAYSRKWEYECCKVLPQGIRNMREKLKECIKYGTIFMELEYTKRVNLYIN